MKALLMSVICFSIIGSSAFAADHNNTITSEQYQCISDSLEAINSDIWYNVSKDEIDEMLNNDMNGHLTTQKAAVRCGVNVQE
ncbi:MAG: hypothetical protein H7336_12185 [Bacteriovorax sp.]|nr:hypothetical protein [Bacteriovorax sp.]